MKLTQSEIDSEILARVLGSHSSESVHLQLRGPIRDDVFSTLMLGAILSRTASTVRIDVAGNALFPESLESYRRALFFPLFALDVSRRTDVSIHGDEIRVASPHISDRAVLAPIHALDLTSGEHYRRSLAALLQHTSIIIHPHTLSLISAIAFEATANAEEHGSTRTDRPEAEVFRAAALVHHEELAHLRGSVRRYSDEYLRLSNAPEHGWLEVIVVDAGMGIAYPTHYLWASERGVGHNLYLEDYAIEYSRVERALEYGHTTKGKWGTILTSQTQPGAGTDTIRKRLGAVRGHASLRAGRAAVEWSYLRSGPRVSTELAKPGYYHVARNPSQLFWGTAWRFIVPLTSQDELPLYG